MSAIGIIFTAFFCLVVAGFTLVKIGNVILKWWDKKHGGFG